MNDNEITKQALMQADREGVEFPYRLVYLRQQEHEKAGRYKEANECASIRYSMELAEESGGRMTKADEESCIAEIYEAEK